MGFATFIITLITIATHTTCFAQNIAHVRNLNIIPVSPTQAQESMSAEAHEKLQKLKKSEPSAYRIVIRRLEFIASGTPDQIKAWYQAQPTSKGRYLLELKKTEYENEFAFQRESKTELEEPTQLEVQQWIDRRMAAIQRQSAQVESVTLFYSEQARYSFFLAQDYLLSKYKVRAQAISLKPVLKINDQKIDIRSNLNPKSSESSYILTDAMPIIRADAKPDTQPTTNNETIQPKSPSKSNTPASASPKSNPAADVPQPIYQGGLPAKKKSWLYRAMRPFRFAQTKRLGKIRRPKKGSAQCNSL